MDYFKALANTAVTIYNYWKDPAADFAYYKRTFIEHAAFDPSSVSKKNKFGVETKYDSNITIKSLGGYMPFGAFTWLSFEDMRDSSAWTLNIGTPTVNDQSYIIIGDIPFEFTAGTVAEINAQSAALRKAYPYNNYRSQLVDEFLNKQFIDMQTGRPVPGWDSSHIEVGLTVSAKQ